jgi:lysophospholipase L1-like esterase
VYKKLLWLLLLVPFQAAAQSTTVSATVTDSDGFVWAAGHIQISFVPSASWPSPNSYVWSGGNLQQNSLFNQTMNSSGAFSISIPDNTTITPSGSQWNFTICPDATTGCVSVVQAVSGGSANLTSILSAAAAGPRFPANPIAYGYGTVEVFPTPKPGYIFFNTTPSASPQCNQWNGFAWQACQTAGGFPSTIPCAISSGCTGATTAGAAQANLEGISPSLAMVFAGDSRCAQDLSNQTWTYVLRSQTQFNGRVAGWHNTCVAGRTIEQMAAAYTTEVQPFKPSTTGIAQTYLFVYVGTNDLSDGGVDTPAVAYTNLAAYWAQAVSDGFTVIALTEPPRGTSSAGGYTSNNIEQFNDLLRTAPPASYFKLVDMALVLPNPYNQNYFQSDYIHPSYPQGNLIEAQYVNWTFGGPYPGDIQSQFDGRTFGAWNFSCDINGLGLTTFAGSGDTACGIMASQNITSGTNDTSLGSYALNGLTTGSFNTGIGIQSLWQETTGAGNTGVGDDTLFNSITATGNTAVGHQALFHDTASSNSAFGYQASFFNSTGLGLASFGNLSGYNNLTGSRNSGFGFETLEQETTVDDMSAFGYEALNLATVGKQSAFGSGALLSETTGQGNDAFGYDSMLLLSTGSFNSAFGQQTLIQCTTCTQNSTFGYASQNANVTATGSSSFGYETLFVATAGPNDAFGWNALSFLTTGINNVGIGYNAGANITTGNQNTAVGSGASPAVSVSNSVSVGFGATAAASNTVQLGNSSVTAAKVGSQPVCLANGTGCPTGFTGTCAPTTTLTVVNGIITGCS